MLNTETILAIDCAGKKISITLVYNGNCVSAESNSIFSLYQIISGVFSSVNCVINDVNTIIYNKGPGYFNNLRMCLSFIIGISYKKPISIYTVNSFMLHLPAVHKQVAITINEKADKVYICILHNCLIIKEPELINKEDIANYVQGFTELKDLINYSTKNKDKFCTSYNMVDLYRENKCSLENEELNLLYLKNDIATVSHIFDK